MKSSVMDLPLLDIGVAAALRHPCRSHVYFKPITGNHNDILFRTSEYIAAGYFHNSQITEVNFAKKTVTFRYKKCPLLAIHGIAALVHPSGYRKTKEKIFAAKTMDVFSFMARMLFYLPDKNRKLIRYYGIAGII
jgi:hypothetical protein